MIARLVVFTLVLLLGATHRGSANDALVRVNHGSGWDALPVIVGVERGFFAQEGLTVSAMPVNSAVAAVDSLIAGTSDFALVPQRTLLLMAATKLDFAVISMNGWGTEMELVVRADDRRTKSVADLKGKTIAVGSGSEALPVLVRLLNQAKLTVKDVELANTNPSQLVNALDQEGVDAVFDTRHFTLALVAKGTGRVVLDADSVGSAVGRIGAAPLVVNKTVLTEEKETVQKFVNGWVKALTYIGQDPEDCARLLQIFLHRQGIEVQGDQARRWISMTRYDRSTWSENDILDAEYNAWGLVAGGVFKEQPKLKGYIDNSFAEAAAKRLGQ